MLWKHPVALPLILLLLAGVYGCNTSETETDVPSPAATDTETDSIDDDGEHDHADHEHDDADEADGDTAAMTDMEKMEATLAKLPPEDRESAMKQHFCPVSGKMLGTMGMPEKIEVEGKTVWICCEACEEMVRAEPEKYLAKLEE